MTHTPLHRLLRQREVEGLLAEFGALLPQTELALLRADGQLFVGSGDWSAAQVLAAPEVVGQAIELYSILVNEQTVGFVAARSTAGFSNPSQAPILRCLQRALSMLASQALERREIGREALERAREASLLHNLSETIGACLDASTIPTLVLAEAARVIHSAVAAVFLAGDNASIVLQPSAHQGEPARVAALHDLAGAVAERAYRTGRPAIVADLPPNAALIAILLCVPLQAQQGQTLGVIVLGRLEGQAEFTAGDERLLMTLARQTGIALENARLHHAEVLRQRLDEELAIGRQIQLSLLPRKLPPVSGWEFAAIYRPAREVGGDLYDLFELPGTPQRLGLIIADVTGKGVPAALFMACSRTVLRMAALADEGPSTALRQANSFLATNTRSKLFLSAFYATLDLQSGQVVYANGGHDYPLWFEAESGECHVLAARSFVLGAFADVRLEQRTIMLAPGDLLVFYTDGVTDAKNAAGAMFDDERLQQVVKAHAAEPAEALLQAIVAAVEAFAVDMPQQDDITILVSKRTLVN